jgi:predicted transcriptional regulator
MDETKAKELKAILERAELWPEAAQDELIEIAQAIEGELKGEYLAAPEELAGIDRGLRAAAEGRFATDEQVEAVLARFRQA